MFSIVTVCLNAEEDIDATLQSVTSQSFRNYEHIIKDGCSTDETLNIVEKFASSNTKVFSSSDSGVYDAFNQALNYSSGEYVNFLGAGDVLYDQRVLDKVNSRILKTNCDLIYGNLEVVKLVQGRSHVVRNWKAGSFDVGSLPFGWMPPHPAVFMRKSIFKKVGFFDDSFSISGDYDLLLRVLKFDGIKVEYLDEPLVKMKFGGLSQRNYVRSFIEDTRIGMKHRNFLISIFKRLRKLNQLNIFS